MKSIIKSVSSMHTVLNLDPSCKFTPRLSYPQKGTPGTHSTADIFVPPKHKLLLMGIEAGLLGHPAHSLVTVLTELPLLLFFDMRTIH
jgi:hypothetical protein